MKKYIFLIMISILFLTGCGKSVSKNQIICTGTEDDEDGMVTTKVTANYKDEKITSVSAEMTFEDEDVAKQTCDMYDFMNSFADSEDKKIEYECKGKTIIIKDLSNFDSEEEENIIGMSKKDFISKMKEQNISCK